MIEGYKSRQFASKMEVIDQLLFDTATNALKHWKYLFSYENEFGLLDCGIKRFN